MLEWHAETLRRIESRTAKVGIVGLGYVGLPVALKAVEVGYQVYGIDVDPDRLRMLEKSESYLVDVDTKAIMDALESGRFAMTHDYSIVRELDVIVICVPTPLYGDMPDLSNVLTAAGAIAEHLHEGILVSLESTTYPGTTEEILRPRLERSGLTAGTDFALVFSPERIDPGNETFGVADIPKIVGGLTETCTQLATAFYSTLVKEVATVRRPREAEMAKLLENTYRQVNIALANEFAMVAHELDVDIWQVIEAAATKPFGFQAFYPGIGIGGHCIAVDPVYLTWRIRELGRSPFRIVELAREVDESMPTYVTKRIARALLEAGLLLRGSSILVLGVTYKPDVADIRESRAFEVMRLLIEAGANVKYHDPFQEEITVGGKTLRSEELDGAVEAADLVCILTHHSVYDWKDIVARATLVFDARGVTRELDDPKIVRL
jgi:nucleotide sugar dehydrogenase